MSEGDLIYSNVHKNLARLRAILSDGVRLPANVPTNLAKHHNERNLHDIKKAHRIFSESFSNGLIILQDHQFLKLL